LSLKPVPPFSFDLSARIFSGSDPHYRAYEGGRFRQVIRVYDKLVLTTIKSTGTVEDPRLSVQLEARSEISEVDKRSAKESIGRIFNVDMDLKPFYKAVRKDPVMSRLVKKLYGLKSPTTPTVFEALVDSIIEQQISLIAAHSMQLKMIKALGDRLVLDGRTYYAFPTPERLAATKIEELRACSLSGRKSEYIKDVSILVSSGRLDLDKFEEYESIDAIRDELSRIRGIGGWTAEMVMIRGLHKMDSIPADDIGLQAKISHFYGKSGRVSSEELRKIAESWGEWRGLGGYYLIVAHHVGVDPKALARGRSGSPPI
jgi:DNA-3-methyladenine glycosylase II